MPVIVKNEKLIIEPTTKKDQNLQYLFYAAWGLIFLGLIFNSNSYVGWGFFLLIFTWFIQESISNAFKKTMGQKIEIDHRGYRIRSIRYNVPSSSFKKYFVDDFDRKNPQFIITLESGEEIDNLIVIQTKFFTEDPEEKMAMVNTIKNYVVSNFSLKEATKEEILEISQYRLGQGGGIQNMIDVPEGGGSEGVDDSFFTSPQPITESWATENSRKETTLFMETYKKQQRSHGYQEKYRL